MGNLNKITKLTEKIIRFIIRAKIRNDGNKSIAISMRLSESTVKRVWIHWMTDTPKSRQACEMSGVGCITGRCPMMYLGGDLSIHGIHRGIAKLMGKY